MKISFENDGKYKYQSAEAHAKNIYSEYMFNGTVELTGYGATEPEAITNLVLLLRKVEHEAQTAIAFITGGI